jgi:hypothetical protein
MNNLESYFNIDQFSLKNKYNEIYNKNIDECAYYALMSSNNKGGFKYKGNNDKCYLYETKQMNHKLSNDDLESYNIKTFFKDKNTIDLEKNEDQSNQYNYFNEINNKYYNIDKLLDKVNVNNEKECLQKCLNDSSNKCKSVIYLEEPKKCTFYKNKDMKSINDIDIDINIGINEKFYTFKPNIDKDNAIKDVKNNIVYNYKNMNTDKTANWAKIRDNPILYKCNGLDSTNPFCTKEYNPNNIENNELQYYTDCLDKQFEKLNEQEKYYSNNCRKKYGNEYVFDNDYSNLDTVIKCDNGKKARCKINMNGNNIWDVNLEYSSGTNSIEHFSEGNCKVYNNDRVPYEEHINNKNLHKKRFVLLLFLFIIIFMFVYGF